MTKFAFLIHARDADDIKNNYPRLKILPNLMLEFLIMFLRPRKLADISVSENQKSEGVKGCFIGVFLTARQMLILPRFFVKWRIRQAVELAEKMGVKVVGLGAFTSSLTNGGLDLSGKYSLGITNGNAFTAEISFLGIKKAASIKGINMDGAVIAIIGATGSTGQAIAKRIACEHSSRLILVGRTPPNLESLKNEITALNPNIGLAATTDIKQAREADIVVVATASRKALIKSEYLKPNAVIYDISQPRNVSPDILENRGDVIVLDGGLAKKPSGVEFDFDLGLPKNTLFSCLSETIILALEGMEGDFSVGKPSLEKVLLISKLAEKHGFGPAPLRNRGELIENVVK